MPMPQFIRRNESVFDKFLELRSILAAAVTVSETTPVPLQFPVRKQFGYRAVVNTKAYTGYTAGTALWTIVIEVSATAGGAYTEVGRYVTTSGNAVETEIPLSGVNIEAVVPTAEFIRSRALLTGGAGGLQYGAYLEELYT